ncbi:structural maintenance of chromosomes protein 4-like [Selaginella moellendorffii]|uniref:structural maintenance of chromosomes protein 4-like n=1 Tax=Selaginella moellendorffii TaxID=88036 RepID=UPI000D1CF246|nr:structural maintenance of chromosomes protein 4-like [Selaginella moellendorffii]|eukprot:XP_024540797.1 structural maintenance of chromosomes protein 4-like [Selaginella moellendorffii]
MDGVEPKHGAGGAPKGPRLFIKEMEMDNFKSYAGKQRVGPFHKCFSAVVGPNGSGKSNVIDALLFVFGRRAKQMRLNKVSELIHNSTYHLNLDKAQVSVHFQEIVDLDDETYEPVPGSDFVITRAAFRDNSSKYYINDNLSSFTEVTKKLRGKGIDLDNNRFLILQGEVEQISLMKPKSQGQHDEGFLEYLEDIIGSNQYVEKIEQASNQLEVLNEKRTSVVQRVKTAEKEKDGLEDAKNEAVTYMLKQVELLKWQGKSSELALKDASAHATKAQKDLESHEAKLKEEREKVAQYSQDLKELEKNYTKHAKRREELEADLKGCADEFKEFERQDLKYQEDLKHMKQKLKKLEDKTAKDELRIQELEKEIEESKIVIPQLEEQILALTKQLGQEEEKLEHLKDLSKDEIERYRESLSSVHSKLEPWDKQIIDCQGKIDVARSESKLLKDKHEGAINAYETAKKQLQIINENLQNKEESLPRQTEAFKQQERLAESARTDEKALLKEEEVLTAEEESAKKRLNEMRVTLESEKSQGAVLRAVLQAKESGQIQGIYGRLGDLGAIDAKYDVAISTACGGLDYIVVETASDAQACVELLRKNNLGVATFLILDKQEGLRSKMNQEVRTPQGVPRLFDLVNVRDGRLKLAFYASLGNTVVATDLNQATRIAYGSNTEFRRVVTLDGALFEKSGTMSGGGGKPRGGRMGTAIRDSSVTRQALESAENEVSTLAEQLAKVRERRVQAARQYQQSEKAISNIQVDISKAQMEVDGLKKQKMDANQQIETLKVEAVPNSVEVKKIEKLDKLAVVEEKTLSYLQENSKGLREKANSLQKSIENAGGEKLKQQKLLVSKIQTDIDSKNTEVNRRKVQMDTGGKTIAKLQKTLEDSRKDKQNISENKEKKASAFKEIEKKAFVVQERYKDIQEIMEKQREELESTKKLYNEKKQMVDQLRTGEIDAQDKVEDLKGLVKEMDQKMKGFQKKIETSNKALNEHVEQIRKEGIDLDSLNAALEGNQIDSVSSLQTALKNVELLEQQMKAMQPNLDTIGEYRTKAAHYMERVNELNAVTQECDDLKKHHDDLRKRRLDDFMAGFNIISLRLKEMYQMITLGGDAELELVDSLDPFSEGVVFSVRPPKKSWKNIGNLSGGEKTLSSLALVFALHHYKPTPLYVMDEIDAALDFKNVSIVGHYVKDRTKDAQFIIISLRNNMFELADRLVGIYKTDNCTKSVTINPKSFATCQQEAA